MKVTDKITEAALAERLDEILDRAHQGEESGIERDGEAITVIRPPISGGARGMTWGEFLATYHLRPRPDDRFADDLEGILADREMMSDGPERPS